MIMTKLEVTDRFAICNLRSVEAAGGAELARGIPPRFVPRVREQFPRATQDDDAQRAAAHDGPRQVESDGHPGYGGRSLRSGDQITAGRPVII